MTPTMTEQREAAERELRMRKHVYPRRVADGKMSSNQARHETACMEAIVETLRELEKKGLLL